jgi:hypothetical protein
MISSHDLSIQSRLKRGLLEKSGNECGPLSTLWAFGRMPVWVGVIVTTMVCNVGSAYKIPTPKRLTDERGG